MFPLWFLLELVIFIKIVDLYGFFNAFAFYSLPSVLGLFILIYYPKSLLMALQKSVDQQQRPTRSMLHTLLITLSGFLFLIPSLTTRLLGLILFLPGLRHILVFVLLWQWFRFIGKFANRFQQGMRWQSFGNGGFAIHSGFYRTKNFEPTSHENPSDAIIDVTPKLDKPTRTDSN